jgi:MscS family membrane protein
LLFLLPVPNMLIAQRVGSAVKKKAAGLSAPQSAPPAEAPPAAAPAPAAAVTPPPPPVDPLGRTSPYGCVLGFLRASEAKDYKRAAQYLDGRRTEQQAQQLAIQLTFLLDKGMSTSIDSISRSPTGSMKDPVRVTREDVGTVKTPKGEIEVLLDQVKRQGEPDIWLFSQETLSQVPAAYATMQHKNYEDYFPEWSKRIRFLSVPLWRWAIILLNVVLMLIAASLLTRGLLWILTVILRKRLTPAVESAVLSLRAPLFGLMLALLLHIGGEYALTALWRHFWDVAALLAVWVSGAWLLVRLADIVVSYARHQLLLRMQVERVTFVSLMGRLFKILVVIVMVLGLLALAGVNISALLAGLGIGGIALALAAQKTLADLFGGFSIVARGAVRVGDFCQIEGMVGTVEDIGTSSLSLRTLDRTLVSIPNSKAAEVKLENFALRDQFWLHQVLTLQFNTPQKAVKTVLDRTVELLTSEPEIDKQSARARLIGFTTSGPQIEIFAYFRRPGADWAAFLAVQERILLRIMGIVESEGTSFAAPVGVIRMDKSDKAVPVDSTSTGV